MKFWVKLIFMCINGINGALHYCDTTVEKAAFRSFYSANCAQNDVDYIYSLMSKKLKLLELYDISVKLVAECDKRERVLIACIVSVLSQERAAELLGIGKSTLKRYIANLLEKLEKILKKNCISEAYLNREFLEVDYIKKRYNQLKRASKSKPKVSKEVDYVAIVAKPNGSSVRSVWA